MGKREGTDSCKDRWWGLWRVEKAENLTKTKAKTNTWPRLWQWPILDQDKSSWLDRNQYQALTKTWFNNLTILKFWCQYWQPDPISPKWNLLEWINWEQGIYSKECWGKQCSKWYAWPDSKLLTKDSNNKAEVLFWKTFVILYWMDCRCNDARLDGNRPSLKTICASWSLRIKQAAPRMMIYLLGCLVEPERRQYAAVEAVRPQFWGRRPNWSLLQDIGPPALLPSTSIKKINFIQVADFQRSSQKRP